MSYAIEICIHNTHVVMNHLRQSKTPGLDFRLELAEALVGDYAGRSKGRVASDRRPVSDERRLQIGEHTPLMVKGLSVRCVVCRERNRKKLTDKVRRVNIKCMECDAPLCVDDTGCWTRYHRNKDFWR